MFSKSDIRRMTTTASYSRGQNLYEFGYVRSMDVDDSMEGMTYIDASVKGSGDKTYGVSLAIEQATNDISYTESHCSCLAYSNYEGICKHCVAVLLRYIDYEKEQEKLLVEVRRKQKLAQHKSQISKGFWKEDRRDTTNDFKRLLLQQTRKNTLPLLQQDTYGKVKVIPYVFYENAELQVEFKIGVKKMYIMKDVITFVRELEMQHEYAYGKNLKFVHMMEAFEPESAPLVFFIKNWVRENMEHYRQAVYYGYRNSYHGYRTDEANGFVYQKVRSIPLIERNLDDFMKIMEKKTFCAALNYSVEQEYYYTDEVCRQKVVIKGVSCGIEVGLLKQQSFCGAKKTYFFLDGKVYGEENEARKDVLAFEACMDALEEKKAFVEHDDIPVFCRNMLPVLRKHYQVETVDFSEEAFGLTEGRIEIYLDAPERNLIQCKVLACYGEHSYSVYKEAALSENRDLIKEAEAAALAATYCNSYNKEERCMYLSEDEDKIYELLTEGIARMQQIAEVYISESMKHIEVQDAPKVNVGVSLSGNLLELQMTAGDMTKEELIDILSKYQRRKKYFRLKNGSFVKMEEEGMETLLELKEGLKLSERELKMDKISIPKYRALYLDAELKEHPGIAAVKNKEFKALVRNMKTVEDSDFEVPEHMKDILREYQKRGFLWIKTLKSNGFAGILADDMGLGKTLQVISFLVSEQEEQGEKRGASLIVTPASLVFNWKHEIEKFAPKLSVRMVVGTASEREAILSDVKNGEILITSYDLLRRDGERYEKMKFEAQIIDEAQFIKNKNTKAAKAVKEISSSFKLALTGTPVENRLSELWSIFDYLMPGFLYSYPRFKEEIEMPIIQNKEEQAMRRLQKMIRPFVMRRLKREVLTDLPDKLEENMVAELDGEQQKLYDAHVKRMKLLLNKQNDEEFKQSKIQILSELTRLRQICCDPALVFADYKGNSTKLDMCMDLIENAISGGHKILLFSQFTTMLDHIAVRLKKAGVPYYTLTGATAKQRRMELVDEFNQDDTPVFCISLKAGGTGLNLTAADIVIHYDPWWNVAVQNQATDRAHRIGQKNVVSVYKLIARGTIEENIVKLQEKKQELADEILSGDGMGAGSFTREEILDLLGDSK